MNVSRRLKIAYLCDISPLETQPYSGGNSNIYAALQKHAGDVTILGRSWGLAEPAHRLIYKLPEAINLRARWRMHLLLARFTAAQVHRELAREQYDVLFGAYSFQSLCRVTPPYPMVKAFTADATPTVYKHSEVGQSFGSFLSASRWFDPLILKAETAIFRSLDLGLWPTEWLKSGADALYGLAPDQSHVVPWGANVADPGPAPSPAKLVPGQPVKLLLIGRDWFAKGGPLAIEIMQMLRDRGLDARLTTIGCVPPPEQVSDAVTVLGHLDKSQPDDLARFQGALRAAHFLVMPSFESFGFAFCEASAYGLPALCLRIGGIPVRDGVNGQAFPPETDAHEFADVICHYAEHPGAYERLRQSSRNEYETRLNWDSWGQSVAELLGDRVASLRRQ